MTPLAHLPRRGAQAARTLRHADGRSPTYPILAADCLQRRKYSRPARKNTQKDAGPMTVARAYVDDERLIHAELAGPSQNKDKAKYRSSFVIREFGRKLNRAYYQLRERYLISHTPTPWEPLGRYIHPMRFPTKARLENHVSNLEHRIDSVEVVLSRLDVVVSASSKVLARYPAEDFAKLETKLDDIMAQLGHCQHALEITIADWIEAYAYQHLLGAVVRVRRSRTNDWLPPDLWDDVYSISYVRNLHNHDPRKNDVQRIIGRCIERVRDHLVRACSPQPPSRRMSGVISMLERGYFFAVKAHDMKKHRPGKLSEYSRPLPDYCSIPEASRVAPSATALADAIDRIEITLARSRDKILGLWQLLIHRTSYRGRLVNRPDDHLLRSLLWLISYHNNSGYETAGIPAVSEPSHAGVMKYLHRLHANRPVPGLALTTSQGAPIRQLHESLAMLPSLDHALALARDALTLYMTTEKILPTHRNIAGLQSKAFETVSLSKERRAKEATTVLRRLAPDHKVFSQTRGKLAALIRENELDSGTYQFPTKLEEEDKGSLRPRGHLTEVLRSWRAQQEGDSKREATRLATQFTEGNQSQNGLTDLDWESEEAWAARAMVPAEFRRRYTPTKKDSTANHSAVPAAAAEETKDPVQPSAGTAVSYMGAEKTEKQIQQNASLAWSLVKTAEPIRRASMKTSMRAMSPLHRSVAERLKLQLGPRQSPLLLLEAEDLKDLTHSSQYEKIRSILESVSGDLRQPSAELPDKEDLEDTTQPSQHDKTKSIPESESGNRP